MTCAAATSPLMTAAGACTWKVCCRAGLSHWAKEAGLYCPCTVTHAGRLLAGIRHRRRMLGLQLHGRPDAVVLSVFEDAPPLAAAEEAAPPSRFRTRDPAAAGAPPSAAAAQQRPAHCGRSIRAEAGGGSRADPAGETAPPWSLCCHLELQQVRIGGLGAWGIRCLGASVPGRFNAEGSMYGA